MRWSLKCRENAEKNMDKDAKKDEMEFEMGETDAM